MPAPAMVSRFILLKSHRSPRSVIYCVNQIEETVGHLKTPSGLFRSLRGIERKVMKFKPDVEAADKFHKFIDSLQRDIADLNNAIRDCWFAPQST